MPFQDELPREVVELMRSATVAQYASVSAAGMPVDTPVLLFPSEGLRSFDLATGLSYPAKAERARRNARVGLLLEGGPDEPVIAIAGMAAVRDADLQANVERYLAESSYTLPHDPDWELARQAVWYWTRIIVEVSPVKVLWWRSPEAMESPPQRWQAPAGSAYPQSDPAPPGKASRPAQWQQMPWQDLAAQALDSAVPGHLTLLDEDGFPLPIRARSVERTANGLAIELPAGRPWAIAGQACLTFGGIETFLGTACVDEGKILLDVDRTLPVFPMTQDMTQLWEPTPDTRAQLMRRLEEETGRRSQPVPTIPLDRPPPSEGYRRRMERMKAAATGRALQGRVSKDG